MDQGEGPNGGENESSMGLAGKGPQMSRQLELPFKSKGEAPRVERSEEEPAATRGDERSGASDLMEKVVSRPNLQAALKRVRKNKGSPGIDGMRVEELSDHLRENWPGLREQLLAGSYQPAMVKQHLIPKSGGGLRKFGIPTVLDRFIQQTLLQVLQPMFDPTFYQHSHCFRPGRRAHDAIVEVQRYVQRGGRGPGAVLRPSQSRCADGRLAKRIGDRRVLGLIRRYLEAGLGYLPTDWRWSATRERRKATPCRLSLKAEGLKKNCPISGGTESARCEEQKRLSK
jgi:hypothetical protein